MYINRNLFRGFFVWLVLLFSTTLYGSIETSLLNQMRTLSESRESVWSAYKAYLMIGTQNNFDNPKKVLKDSIDSFESAIKSVKEYAKSHNIKELTPVIKDIDKDWSKLKKILLNKPSKDKVVLIDKSAKRLIKHINKALNIMGSYDKSGDWKYLAEIQKAQNIAQRMGTLYLAYSWGALDNRYYDKAMEELVNGYENIIKFIKSSKYYSPKMDKMINHASSDYKYFKMMWKAKNKIFIPTLIYQRSSEMAEHMEETTDLVMAQLKE